MKVLLLFFQESIIARTNCMRCILARKNNIVSPSSDKLFAVGIETVCGMIEDAIVYKDIAAKFGVSTSSLYKWLSLDEHEDDYARAVSARAERIVDQVLEISDMAPGMTDSGMTDSGAVAHQRLRVDSRKWLASKMLPRKYGDSSTLEIANKDDKPFKTQDLTSLSVDELKALQAIRNKLSK